MSKIEIGIDKTGAYVSSAFDCYDDCIDLCGKEKEAFEMIGEILKDAGIDIEKYRAVQRSNDYTTLLIGESSDFCRIHFGERAKWISIDMWGRAKAFKEDAKFSNVKNKNQRYWKVKVNNLEDLREFRDIIIEAAKL